MPFALKSTTLYAESVVVVYGIAVVVGSLALVAWIVADAFADAPDDSRRGPSQRYGESGQSLVTAVLGFGLGGMSASFAGWHAVLALTAAIAGGVALAAGTRLLADDHA